jgi:hypothetical protein
MLGDRVVGEEKSIIKKPINVGLVMISTNNYLKFWKDCVTSVEKYCFYDSESITIHLFTDKVEEAENWSKNELKRIRLVTYKIPSWGWPEVTLYRYKFICEAGRKLSQDLLMYLDSDMIVKKSLSLGKILPQLGDNLGVVLHPGFFRPTDYSYIRNVFKDKGLRGLLFRKYFRREPGFGSWETNRKSTAFVPRRSRKVYFHGAIWFAKNEVFKEVSKILQTNVDRDLENKYIAVWHDESHLNWYTSTYPNIAIFTPELSGFEPYLYLRGLETYIETRSKPLWTGRQLSVDTLPG